MARTREEATSASADAPARRASRASADGVSKPEAGGRARGRPRSDKPPKEPTGRPRGRPRLNKPPKEPSGRPRGRPKGSGKKPGEKKTPTKTTAAGAGSRGRPRKLGGEAAALAKTPTPKSKKGRGRPRKSGDATLVAEAETVEEAKHAAEELEAAAEEGMDVDAPEAGIRGDAEDVEDSEDAEGDDEALDSPSGIASSREEDTGQQWISKIKGYFA
ncbi:hypothetical protein J3458_003627 [Metarhizium acridum]|uniref:uncharacterized protein n=1 Tax=Metarhizium acridum TaxID=92637 RepID=UPI001C6B5230|nr:hypothetical protein J3458_003627 [Metarhizium acridum]